MDTEYNTLAILDDNGKVINIIVADDDYPKSKNVIKYNKENPAAIGGHYVDGYFYFPQPYPSWTKDKGEWVAPVPQPKDGYWIWNEEQLRWLEMKTPPVTI